MRLGCRAEKFGSLIIYKKFFKKRYYYLKIYDILRNVL